jgi:hypothetical protein
MDHPKIAMESDETPILCGYDLVSWGDVYRAIYTFGTRYIDIVFSYMEKECREAGVRYLGLNRNKNIHL